MENVDLFDSVVRYLAVKPLAFDEFDLEKAKMVIKAEKKDSIFFTADHPHFEDILESLSKKISAGGQADVGILYICIKGRSCSERLKRVLMDLVMKVRKTIIFGVPSDWMFLDKLSERVQFTESEEFLEENHQRFFIYQSPGFNVSLVARHTQEKTMEAAVTNDHGAVAMLGQTVGVNIYREEQSL